MIFKNLLRIMLPAVLLAGSATAYAEGDATGEVTLTGGTAITWAQFVQGVNNGSLPGVVQGTADLTQYENTISTANQTKTDAQQTKEDNQAKLDELGQAVTTAEGKLKTFNDAKTVENAEAAYNTAKDVTLPAKQADLETAKTEQTNLMSDQNTATNNYNSAKTDYNNYVAQINALPKKTGTVGWMQTIITTAKNFSSAYEKDKTTPEIWYTYEQTKSGISLYLSFTEAQPTWDPEDKKINWTQIDPVSFYNTIIVPTATESVFKTYDIIAVYVYMGEKYAALNGNDPVYTVSTYDADSKKATLVTKTVTAVTNLGDNAKYQSTTDEVQDDYVQQQQDLIAKRNAAEALMTQYYRELNGFKEGDPGWTAGTPDKDPEDEGYVPPSVEIVGINTKLANIKTTISTLTSDINTLNTTTIPNLLKAWNAALQKQAELEKAVTDAQADLDAANKAITDAEAAIAQADKDIEQANADKTAAQAAADKEAFANAITEITLTANVIATEPITKDYTGTISGGKDIVITNAITDTTNPSIFRNFYGKLDNAAVSGYFAKSTQSTTGAKAVFDNVVYAYEGGNIYRMYDDSGNVTTCTSLGLLGYAARNLYGVNFSTKALVALTDESKVYRLFVYNSPDTDPEEMYATQNNSNFTSINGAFKRAANVFVKSADIIDTEIPNVIYPNANNNLVCKNVEIEDAEDFYSPVAFKATNLSYSRTFKAGQNAVCLPFKLDTSLSEDIEYVADYDKEEGNRFWFTIHSGAIAANTPVLLGAKKEFKLELGNIDIAATPAKQFVSGGNDAGTTESFGTFKGMLPGEFKGQSQGAYVYGLTTNGTFKAAAETTTFKSFRMVIWSDSKLMAPRRIGIRDEQGKEITFGGGTSEIEDVVADAPQFNIKGGVGELTITSEANYGKVDIYTIDGRMAATTEVTEGTTSVSLQGGVYIVMGKKVLVK